MLIPLSTLAAIETGQVTLAYRRWDRARVKAGTKLRTSIGLVEVTSVEAVSLSGITAQEARLAGYPTKKVLTEFLAARAGKVFRIGLKYGGADPRIALRNEAGLSNEDAQRILVRLATMDSSAKREPWTLPFLRMIAERPGVRAPDLAASIGWETLVFKRYVRRLKELGLTESLEIGYRLSPRGQVVLAAAGAKN
jgi:hypothetical protein